MVTVCYCPPSRSGDDMRRVGMVVAFHRVPRYVRIVRFGNRRNCGFDVVEESRMF